MYTGIAGCQTACPSAGSPPAAASLAAHQQVHPLGSPASSSTGSPQAKEPSNRRPNNKKGKNRKSKKGKSTPKAPATSKAPIYDTCRSKEDVLYRAFNTGEVRLITVYICSYMYPTANTATQNTTDNCQPKTKHYVFTLICNIQPF